MRRCCCCVSVHTGSIILGVLGILLSLLELVPIVPYLAEYDGFNPIQENMKEFTYVTENILEEHNMTKAEAEKIVQGFTQWLGTGLLVEGVLAGMFALFSFLMVSGVACKQRILMLPYLIQLMLCILLFVIFGVVLSVVAFFVSLVTGGICLALVCITTFFSVYFWVAVQKSFKELGTRDYMYSPAPLHAERHFA